MVSNAPHLQPLLQLLVAAWIASAYLQKEDRACDHQHPCIWCPRKGRQRRGLGAAAAAAAAAFTCEARHSLHAGTARSLLRPPLHRDSVVCSGKVRMKAPRTKLKIGKYWDGPDTDTGIRNVRPDYLGTLSSCYLCAGISALAVHYQKLWLRPSRLCTCTAAVGIQLTGLSNTPEL